VPKEVTGTVAKIMNATSFSVPIDSEEKVRVAGQKYNIIRTDKGVQQGSVISPSLFSIYLVSLLKELEPMTGCRMAYADDLAFTCNSKEKLRGAIRITNAWCNQTGMEVNKDKSAIMVLRKDRRTPGVERNNGDEKIEGIGVVTAYKYLGITVEDTMECNKSDEAAKEGSRLSRKMESIFKKLKNIPVQLAI
jgi:hypothetical protein